MINKIELDEVYTIWYQPFWKKGYIIIVAMAIIMLIALFILYRNIKKNFYWRKALKNTNRLLADLLNSKIDNITCYFRLIDILRKYTGDLFKVPTYYITDYELLNLIKKLSVKDVDLIIPVLSNGVKAKFAHDNLDNSIIIKDIKSVREFIEKTKNQKEVLK